MRVNNAWKQEDLGLFRNGHARSVVANAIPLLEANVFLPFGQSRVALE